MFRRVVPLLVVFVLLLSGISRATSVVNGGLDAQEAAASLVFQGRVTQVTSIVSTLSNGRELPFTLVTVAVSDWIKGDPRPTVTFRMLGGPLPGGGSLVVQGAPHFTVGEQVCLMLRDDPRSSLPIVGVNEGCYRLRPDAASAVRVYDHGGRAISSVDGNGRVTRSQRPSDALDWSDFRAALKAHAGH